MAAAPTPVPDFKVFAAPVNCAGADCVIDAIDPEPLITGAPVPLVAIAVDVELDIIFMLDCPVKFESKDPNATIPPQGAMGAETHPPNHEPNMPTFIPSCRIISGVKAGVSIVLLGMKPTGCIIAWRAAA